jgi:hypothetical protein
MFRVVPPPIIRSASNCIYSIWYLSYRNCYLPLSWKCWNRFECAVSGLRQITVTVLQIPDAVDTVVCAPDDGWRYQPKHAEQFPDKINCVKLHLVGYILECYLECLVSKLILNSKFSVIPNLYALSVQKQSFNAIIFQI